MNLRSALVLVLFSFCTAALYGDETTVTSPDGRNAITIDCSQDGVKYSVSRDGKLVLTPAMISLTIDGAQLPGDASTVATQQRQVDLAAKPVAPTISAVVRNHFNELLLEFGGDTTLCVRVYDDGVAFRWETSFAAEEVQVDAEQLSFAFADDYQAYFPVPNGEGFFSHQECEFRHVRLSETANEKAASAPLLVDLGDQQYMLISDVNVEGYPGLWLEGSDDATITATFPHFPAETQLEGDRNDRVVRYADYLAETRGRRAFPWRALVLTDAPGLLTSTMLYNLAAPSRIADASWIRPGKIAWDWWNALNVHDVPFRSGVNQDTYKHYIDFAAEMDLQYVILDEGWSRRGVENLLSVVPEIDVPGLVQYGKSKDVGVILWMTAASLEASYDAAMQQFAAWGVAGLKIDFMQRDDQPMMDFMYRAAEDAAERHLLVDFHGGSKPAGLLRTWPNVLTNESVLGLEQAKWSEHANPEMAVLLPFNRMVVGPMDYTPGAMINLQRSNFHPMFTRPASMGTRAHQLAMYVVFVSPLQMLADTPTHYRENPESLPFLRRVPSTWDEMRVLHADVGEAVAVARRKGDTWYIGALTNWEARDLTLSLSFLSDGTYNLIEWTDGPNADRYGSDVSVNESIVDHNNEHRIHLAPGGGYAAVVEPTE